MQTIIITVKNKKTLTKLQNLLKQFQENEISIQSNSIKPQNKKKKYSNSYIQKNWKKIAYAASGNLSMNDKEVLPEAYIEYLNDKSSF